MSVTKWRRNTAANFNRLSRVHERYRQTTDGRATAYSERECELMFAKTASAPLFPFTTLFYKLSVQIVTDIPIFSNL